MSTGALRRGGSSGNRKEKRQLDAFSKELRRRPEVRIINNYAVVMAYIRMAIKGTVALLLLWATVVLLGGFVSDLSKADFQFVAIIAFVQAAGFIDAMADARYVFFLEWLDSLGQNITSQGEKLHHEQLTVRQWLKRKINVLLSKAIYISLIIIISPLLFFALSGPLLCLILSKIGLSKQDYGIAIGDANKANLKPALTSFYYVSFVHSIICMLLAGIEDVGDFACSYIVSQENGLSRKVLRAYLRKTKQMCVSNPSCIVSWNLITYGTGLLDSQLPEDYVSGGRVLTLLIDHDIPLLIRRLVIWSPRQIIQKLIGTLAWRSPDDQEMRWLAARIVEHLARDLNIAHFPGALECISSLFDTFCHAHNNGDQEALHLQFAIEHNKLWEDKDGRLKGWKGRMMSILRVLQEKIRKKYGAPENGATLEQDTKHMANGEEIDEDLVLPGLRILENLAHDSHNCTLIYKTKDLLSKIVAPISSNKLVENIKSNVAWAKVVNGSLKVVSRLMGSSGRTGEEMRSLIAGDSNAVKNLEAVLDMNTEIDSGIIELQIGAIEILTQLSLHQPTSTSTENFIKRALHIFVTTNWMEDYLKDEKRRSKEAKETASLLKEKAGEALAMLSSDSEARKSFIGCKDDDIHHVTELLDSKFNTIKCQISATHTVEIEINIGCRISAAVILKHLSNYDKELTLRKVLAELFPVQAEASINTRCWERVLPICCRNDIENPMDGGQDQPSASQSHNIQQCGDRRLQAELISLVAAIRANNNLDFAAVLISPPQPVALEDFVLRLKKMVEDNMYATPACLAIHKLTCEMVIEFIQHDRNVEVIDKHDIVGTLLNASKAMAGLESSMLFAGIDRDCHGVPVTPLSSVLAKNAEVLLARSKQDLGINIAPAGVSLP